jgi:hypothetical protein
LARVASTRAKRRRSVSIETRDDFLLDGMCACCECAVDNALNKRLSLRVEARQSALAFPFAKIPDPTTIARWGASQTR